MSELNYGRMMQRAMQGLVVEAMSIAAENGLPGEHHFYITFITRHPGVDMPDWLRERYPNEMMIVLQYEFNNLVVTQDRFSVELDFDDKPVTLVIPFDAVLQFADPSAEFGLRFDPSDHIPDDEPAEEPETEETGEKADASADVVSLDAFRKKS